MAALVTNEEVQSLLGESGVDMTPFITTAHLIVSEELITTTISDARKKQIELYLAAHFYVVIAERGGITREVIGDAEERYRLQPDTLTGLATTRFGEQALAMDTSGSLAKLAANPVKAAFRVV